MFQVLEKTNLYYYGDVTHSGDSKVLLDFDVVVKVEGYDISIKSLLSDDILKDCRASFMGAYEIEDSKPSFNPDESFDVWQEESGPSYDR